MSKHEIDGEPIEITWRKREQETIPVQMPKTALASLKEVAENKGMSIGGSLKLYIGRGLRKDLHDLAANHTGPR
ncbi:hypothetical protein IQ266_10605 [filamentous cyanobacterium LEGE 11480]|uniref:Uncharacterized protein n=1 Tax=Romeriopsis navalis LEGE 11480 TaxID=2777977 RepID=A0A928VQB7_9CYAN|nr:hypothetical protein [Romeriopsis navalis]MBE9030179.1 hypothetical protein [Romeriopsis navalis LEGE 11480]